MPPPVAERGYARPELLAETDWLAEHLSDPAVRVVDARTDEDYAAGHIGGAVHVSGFSLGGIRGASEGMPQPEAFAQLVGALGIDEQTTVVVYDSGGVSQMAGMTAWAFLYYGATVRYLDGGLTKWTAEGRPVSTEAPAHDPRTFAADVLAGVFCSLDQAKAAVDDPGTILWDVRTSGEFDGSAAGWNPPPRLGHIPGAIRLDYAELFDVESGTLKPAAELTTLLGAKGITPESAVATY